MQRLIGILVGLAIAGALLAGLAALLGGGLLAVFATLVSLPVVFPLTTTAAVLVLAVLWVRHRRAQRRSRDRG